MDHAEEMLEAARFFDLAIGQIAGLNNKQAVRVLDFGCGAGDMMNALALLGYQTFGCDIVLPSDAVDSARVRQITQKPYRIPFDNEQFDVVTSTSVLEHTRNPNECMAEISRVLKPGGCAMHLFPSKWYLPTEPHIYVPLVNFFWPRCPTWWFVVWAWLGRRNSFQQGASWRETVARNRAFFDNNLNYLTTRQYDQLSRRCFTASEWPMEFYVAHGYGGFTSLARRLPFPQLWGWISREFRMSFLVQRKGRVGT